MKYVALFENWQEPFMDRYNRALKLFDLGLASSPFSHDSPIWLEFKRIVNGLLEDRGYRIEESWTDTNNSSILTISYGHDPHLRLMIKPNFNEPEKIYLLGPNYMELISVNDPLVVIKEILRLADKIFKPEA
jgi:hypothetical protein